jgi:hypothetical protein
MDEEPPSKIQASSVQCSSSVAIKTISQKVFTQEHFDIAHEVISSIIDKIVKKAQNDLEIKQMREVEKRDEKNRLRRTTQYGPTTNDTAQRMQIKAVKQNENATQTRDLIHKSMSF